MKRIPKGVLTVFHPSPQLQEKIVSFAQYYLLLLLGLYLIVFLVFSFLTYIPSYQNYLHSSGQRDNTDSSFHLAT